MEPLSYQLKGPPESMQGATAAERDESGVAVEPRRVGDQAASGAVEEELTEVREYDPYSFSREMARLEELNKMLNEVKQRLNQVSVRSLLLNVDVVTQFDPHMVEGLRQLVQDCETCTEHLRSGGDQREGGENATGT